ncbi:hypothetical protein [Nonomuraea rhodomycinica]|uniref:Uncharacterized protein n=1 Tax=Nonomuraea rhodomycinica TaxID=1712872 RepID=A0A7Y6IV37_9ACTN|nr:hypothetical protein [Nonomuraea rhodomycinica]NUW44408.1 hypothetical protein [Nonomuraea rhodomycinica]
MFKRRVGIMGAVGVLALSILSGSAMADETPAPVPDVTIVCRTGDGQVVRLAKAAKAVKVEKLKDGRVVISEGEPVEPGKMTRIERKPLSPEEAEKLAKALPEGTPRMHVERAEPADEAGAARIEDDEKAWIQDGRKVKEGEILDAVPAVPALPADGPDGAPPKGVTAPAATVTCEAGDK